MRAVRIPTNNGIDDVKLISENESESTFLRQLADAGTLSCVTGNVGSSIVFRAASILEPDYNSYEVNAVQSIGRFDFTVRQNEQRSVDLAFSTSAGPMDISQYEQVILQVKKSKGSSAVISLTLGDGLAVTGAENNVLSVSFSSQQTSLLLLQEYYYDVLFVAGVSNVYYLEGTITITPSVSR